MITETAFTLCKNNWAVGLLVYSNAAAGQTKLNSYNIRLYWYLTKAEQATFTTSVLHLLN